MTYYDNNSDTYRAPADSGRNEAGTGRSKNSDNDTGNDAGKDNDSKIAYSINYGNAAVVFPRSAVDRMPTATKRDILVLSTLLQMPGTTLDKLVNECGISREEVVSSLGFWCDAGVIAEGETGAVRARMSAGRAKHICRFDRSLPTYSKDETAQTVEQVPGIADTIDECERQIGRLFRNNEAERLVSLIEYIGVEGNYMVNLCAHCARIGKASLRYVETMAISLYDRGIMSLKDLDDYIYVTEAGMQAETQIRSMFGMSMTRELTSKEKKYIESWTGSYGYDTDIIRIAYEITVDTIKEPSLAYANAIIESWHGHGYTTIEEIQKDLDARKNGKGTDAVGKSFDSDSFFEAALRRSYGDDNASPDIPPSAQNQGNATGKKRR